MQDVGPQLGQQAAEGAHLEQGGQRLAVHRQRDVLAAFTRELVNEAAAAGDHDRAVAGRHQCPGNLQRAALDAAGVQGRQCLHHGHFFLRLRHFFGTRCLGLMA